jgi:hypothetical protein
MTGMFFGEPWDAPIVDDAVQLPEVPTYAACIQCDEQIVETDQGFIRPYVGNDVAARYLVGIGPGHQLVAVHRECDLSSVLGHTVGVCLCTGYPHNRETAREVLRRVEEGHLWRR